MTGHPGLDSEGSPLLDDWVVVSDVGWRLWAAEDQNHAREQHEDAFPEEPIESIFLSAGTPYTRETAQ